ncbi:bis(5'-nucleosyl)-tetraphosphatase (symmetrical) YqeK [Enterococcus sp. 2201sp1_2201st1_B8_2201SCRN_220225]|uniref:bis(5'-nucleosyl)-tetraphosphatase (symmetrical) YqeK n=1 Tax=unclassified Enterococcus TaxID=2608891 RepID=UPI0034A1D22C
MIEAHRFSDIGKGLEGQVLNYLQENGQEATFSHLLTVAEENAKWAHFLGLDEEAAYDAGLLHDISVVIPDEERLAFHKEHHLDILKAERHLPMLLHQQQSAILAQEVFQVTNPAILSAIGCHTTLKEGASTFDCCLFLADKIKWDRGTTPPYLDELMPLMHQKDLKKAAWLYLDWLFNNDIQVIHPWALAALKELRPQAVTK